MTMGMYFTSDLHIGHDKPFIWQLRGHQNVWEHDREIERSLRSLRCDHLCLLGDVMMGTNKAERLVRFIRSLPYPVTLIIGNHDPAVAQLLALAPDLDIHTSLDLEVEGVQVTLSHYPANFVDHRGRDFTAHLPPDDGRIVLHGHTHSSQRFSVSPNGTRQLHVGWDSWAGPVTSKDLLALLTSVAPLTNGGQVGAQQLGHDGQMDQARWQQARLIPTTGISGQDEQEMRATKSPAQDPLPRAGLRKRNSQPPSGSTG